MDNIEELIKKVDELYESDKYEEAIPICIQILDQDKNNLEILITLANMCATNGEINLAYDAFDKLDKLDLTPDYLEKRNNNYSYFQLSLSISALNDLDEYDETDHEAIYAQINLAQDYLDKAEDTDPTWENLLDEFDIQQEKIDKASNNLIRISNHTIHDPSENTIFDENDIYVSDQRFVVPEQTYAISGITSVLKWVTKPSIKVPLILVALGIIPWFFGGFGMIIIGLLLIGGGVFMFIRNKPTYSVYITTAAGEEEAFNSKDELFVDNIVQAINDAIVARG